MSDPLKDILSNSDKNIDSEKLLQYLGNNMEDNDQHAFEKQMNEDEFMNDAVEGLQEVQNKRDITDLVHQLNADLKKQLEKKKERKNKRKPADLRWVYYTIIVLLILLVTAYLVIRRYG